MYEELVKRLQIAAQLADKGLLITPSICLEAADAIEELIKGQKHLAEQVAKWQAEVVKGDCEAWLSEQDRPRWIPVTERLPEKGIEVLVFAEGKIEGFFGDTVMAISGRYDFKIFTDSEAVEVWQSPWQYFLTDYEITHWMPLPEPPKDGE